MASDQDVTAASGGDEDLALRGSLVHGGDLVALDGGLEGVDGINLGDEDAGTHAAQSAGAALADITISSNNSDLTSDHDIGGTLDTVDERLAAAVQVVELGLGDGVVDVDGRDQQLALLEHAVKVVDTSGGLLRQTEAALELIRVLGVDERGQVTTVVEDEVELLATVEGLELLVQAPVVLFLGLTLPGEAIHVRLSFLNQNIGLHRDTSGGNGSSSVVLGGEDVAAGPGDLSAEGNQSLDEDRSLNGWENQIEPHHSRSDHILM